MSNELQLQLSGAFERDKALESLRGKYSTWIDRVGAPLFYRFLQRNQFFTTDDVWDAFGDLPTPSERRVMGALVRGFALRGLIEKTGFSEKSRMVACHSRDKAVWESRLYEGR